MPKKKQTPSISTLIHNVQDHRVILDRDLAVLYGVSNKVLLQALRRNQDRFPADFVFRLTNEEFSRLRPQIEAANGRGGRRDLPFAFTEQGVAMLSGVLQSPQAVAVNIAIMREFVKLRNIAGLRAYATEKLEALEKRVDTHDIHLERVFEAIERMLNVPEPPKRRIGFGRDEETNKLKNRKS